MRECQYLCSIAKETEYQGPGFLNRTTVDFQAKQLFVGEEGLSYALCHI
jgi:hypothetical protein